MLDRHVEGTALLSPGPNQHEDPVFRGHFGFRLSMEIRRPGVILVFWVVVLVVVVWVVVFLVVWVVWVILVVCVVVLVVVVLVVVV
jgi:hypothetical protein